MVLAFSWLLGCSAGVGSGDAGREGDAGSLCDDDAFCDDGLSCNGEERCVGEGGDARGCAPGAPVRCGGTQRCDEDTDRCVDTGPCAMPDADGDAHASLACGGDDCDDADASRYPGHAEVCDGGHDEDCDAASVGPTDADADGHIASECCNGEVCGDDCDDTDPAVFSGAPEGCNGRDDDCDGASDEGLLVSDHYADCDGDGAGTSDAAPFTGCGAPAGAPACTSPGPGAGWVRDASDCDDARADVRPGAAEACNGRDDDCDGVADEEVALLCYRDLDGDGRGTDSSTVLACSCPSGYVPLAGDCDDTPGRGAAIYPGATEIVANGVDDDCDGLELCYVDADGDGYGSTTTVETTDLACTTSAGQPTGYAPDDTDCDDTDPSIHPGVSPDVTDGVDSDCDGFDALCGSSVRYVPAEYPTIQAAIDASCDGDRIEVSPGTYPEDVSTRRKALTIVGVSGSGMTHIVGTGTRSVVILDGDTWFEGFTISGGSATQGGGLYAIGANFTLVDLVLDGNTATEVGGGVYVVGARTLVLESCSFTHNVARIAGGGAHLGGTVVEAYRLSARYNTSDSGAGIVFHYSAATLIAEDIEVSDNVGNWGPLVANAVGTAELRRLTSVRNTRPGRSGGFGGGLFVTGYDGAVITLEDVTLEDNVMPSGFGGGAYLTGAGARGTWTGGTISRCGASFGSGLYVQSGSWDIAGIALRDNVSDSTLGAVWVNNGARLGLSNAVVAGNNDGVSVGGGSGAIASLALTNVDVVGNGSPTASGASPSGVSCRSGGRLTMTNVTSAHHLGYGIDASGCDTASIAYSNLFGNGSGPVNAIADPTGSGGNVAVVPGYTAYTSGTSAILWDLRLALGSALVDAGSPALLDVDGSRSDIGAYGGPGGAW